MINKTINQKDSERIKNLYQQLNYFNGKKADTLSGSEKLQLMALYRSSQNIKGFPPLPTELKKLILETIRTQKVGSSNDIAMAAAAHEQQIRTAEIQEQIFAKALQSNPYLMYDNLDLTLRAIENGSLAWNTTVTLDNGKKGTFTDFLVQNANKLEQEYGKLETQIESYNKKNKQVLFTLANMTPEERAKKLEEISKIDPTIAKSLEKDLKDDALMDAITNSQYKPMSDEELSNHAKTGKKLETDKKEFRKKARAQKRTIEKIIEFGENIPSGELKQLKDARDSIRNYDFLNRQNGSSTQADKKKAKKPGNSSTPVSTGETTPSSAGLQAALQKNAKAKVPQDTLPSEQEATTKEGAQTGLAAYAQPYQSNTFMPASKQNNRA